MTRRNSRVVQNLLVIKPIRNFQCTDEVHESQCCLRRECTDANVPLFGRAFSWMASAAALGGFARFYCRAGVAAEIPKRASMAKPSNLLKVAVGQMTASADIQSNFQTCAGLVQVWLLQPWHFSEVARFFQAAWVDGIMPMVDHVPNAGLLRSRDLRMLAGQSVLSCQLSWWMDTWFLEFYSAAFGHRASQDESCDVPRSIVTFHYNCRPWNWAGWVCASVGQTFEWQLIILERCVCRRLWCLDWWNSSKRKATNFVEKSRLEVLMVARHSGTGSGCCRCEAVEFTWVLLFHRLERRRIVEHRRATGWSDHEKLPEFGQASHRLDFLTHRHLPGHEFQVQSHLTYQPAVFDVSYFMRCLWWNESGLPHLTIPSRSLSVSRTEKQGCGYHWVDFRRRAPTPGICTIRTSCWMMLEVCVESTGKFTCAYTRSAYTFVKEENLSGLVFEVIAVGFSKEWSCYL